MAVFHLTHLAALPAAASASVISAEWHYDAGSLTGIWVSVIAALLCGGAVAFCGGPTAGAVVEHR